MKITKRQLKQIIKEELQTEWNTGQETDGPFTEVMTQASYEEIIEIVKELRQDVDLLHLQRAPDPADYADMGKKLERIIDLMERGY